MLILKCDVYEFLETYIQFNSTFPEEVWFLLERHRFYTLMSSYEFGEKKSFNTDAFPSCYLYLDLDLSRYLYLYHNNTM